MNKHLRLVNLARKVIDFLPNQRSEKFWLLKEAVQDGSYRMEAEKICEKLLCQDQLDLSPLLACCPALIPEYLRDHRAKPRLWPQLTRDLLRALQLRDGFSGRHSIRSTALSIRFARHLGLPRGEQESLKMVGLLHDIGKITLAPAILCKKGSLESKEFALVQAHPMTGEELLRPLGLQDRQKDLVRLHHERWDGFGYPHGLAGKSIPLLCRVLSLADVFEALTTRRPFRPPHPLPEALEIIRAQSGAQFDPELVPVFLEMVTTGHC